MGGHMARIVDICCQPKHLRRTTIVSIVVGTWLTLFNQGAVLLSDPMSVSLASVVLLNYLTPFIVANAGLLSNTGYEQT